MGTFMFLIFAVIYLNIKTQINIDCSKTEQSSNVCFNPVRMSRGVNNRTFPGRKLPNQLGSYESAGNAINMSSSHLTLIRHPH